MNMIPEIVTEQIKLCCQSNNQDALQFNSNNGIELFFNQIRRKINWLDDTYPEWRKFESSIKINTEPSNTWSQSDNVILEFRHWKHQFSEDVRSHEIDSLKDLILKYKDETVEYLNELNDEENH